MAILRKILFYIFTVVYLTVCPLTILYALGYLFQPGPAGGVVKTGLLYLSTLPPGASVDLADTRCTEKTPTIIRNLLPGDYPLRISLEGNQPWLQTVPIEAGKSTVFDKILLLPDKFDPIRIAGGPYEQMTPILGTPFLLLHKGPQLRDLFLYDQKRRSISPLCGPDARYGEAKLLSIETAAKSSRVLLGASLNGEKLFLWTELEETPPEIQDISGLLTEKPAQIGWDPDEKRSLFFCQDKRLHRIDLETREIFQLPLDPIQGYGLHQGMLYLLSTDGSFSRFDANGENEERLIHDPVVTRPLFGENGPFRIEPLTREITLFLGDRGNLLASRLPYRFVDSGVRGFEFDADREHLLLWQRDKIGILDFSKKEQENDAFQQGPRLVWIYKNGRDIEQAFWVHEGSYLLFRDQNGLYLIELETYGKPTVTMLLRVKSGSSIAYSEETGRVDFIEQGSGDLCSIGLVPRWSRLPFAEKPERLKKRRLEEP